MYQENTAPSEAKNPWRCCTQTYSPFTVARKKPTCGFCLHWECVQSGFTPGSFDSPCSISLRRKRDCRKGYRTVTTMTSSLAWMPLSGVYYCLLRPFPVCWWHSVWALLQVESDSSRFKKAQTGSLWCIMRVWIMSAVCFVGFNCICANKVRFMTHNIRINHTMLLHYGPHIYHLHWVYLIISSNWDHRSLSQGGWLFQHVIGSPSICVETCHHFTSIIHYSEWRSISLDHRHCC